MGYKKIISFAIILAPSAAAIAQVAVPVYDMVAETQNVIRHQELLTALADSSTQVAAQISNSVKAMTQLGTEIDRQNAERQALQFIAEQKRINAEKYSKDFGAKVKDACALVKGAREANSGQIAKKRIFNQTVKVSDAYLERGRHRSPNEPVKTGEAASFLTKFKKINDYDEAKLSADPQGSMIDNSMSLSTSRDATGRSEYSIELERKMILLNPFSDALSDDYDSPTQPASALPNNAHAKWKIEILKAINRNEAFLLANKATAYGDGWASNFFEETPDGIAMKSLALGASGRQGYYSTLDLINKSRTFNPAWVTYTSTQMSQEALLRDANLIAAQSLVNQSEIIRLLVMVNENLHLSFANDHNYYWRGDSTSTTPQ